MLSLQARSRVVALRRGGRAAELWRYGEEAGLPSCGATERAAFSSNMMRCSSAFTSAVQPPLSSDRPASPPRALGSSYTPTAKRLAASTAATACGRSISGGKKVTSTCVLKAQSWRLKYGLEAAPQRLRASWAAKWYPSGVGQAGCAPPYEAGVALLRRALHCQQAASPRVNLASRAQA